MLVEFCCTPFSCVSEGDSVVSMMRFKLIAGEAYICFLVVFAFDSNLVYDVSGYRHLSFSGQLGCD